MDNGAGRLRFLISTGAGRHAAARFSGERPDAHRLGQRLPARRNVLLLIGSETRENEREKVMTETKQPVEKGLVEFTRISELASQRIPLKKEISTETSKNEQSCVNKRQDEK